MAEIRDEKGSLLGVADIEPVCGEDFCDRCGDCLDCHGRDGFVNDCKDGHRFIIYIDGRWPEFFAPPAPVLPGEKP